MVRKVVTYSPPPIPSMFDEMGQTREDLEELMDSNELRFFVMAYESTSSIYLFEVDEDGKKQTLEEFINGVKKTSSPQEFWMTNNINNYELGGMRFKKANNIEKIRSFISGLEGNWHLDVDGKRIYSKKEDLFNRSGERVVKKDDINHVAGDFTIDDLYRTIEVKKVISLDDKIMQAEILNLRMARYYGGG